MKSLSLLLWTLLCLFKPDVSEGAAVPVDVVTAIAQRQVAAQARASGLEAENLTCTITNLTTNELQVAIPVGLRFAAIDSSTQDLLTYHAQLLTLAAGGSGVIRLRGLCMEQHNNGPYQSGYMLRGRAKPVLLALADSLAKYPRLAEDYGQLFVWALTDNASVDEVSVTAANQQGARNILRYLSTVTGRAAGRVTLSTTGRPSVHFFSRNVTLRYRSPVRQVVSLKVYGADGSERFTVIRNQQLRPGNVDYAFGLNVVLRRDEPPTFTVRLINASGQVLREVPVSETSPETEAPTVKQPFDVTFTLDKAVKNARLRVRLPDGTLVQELKQLPYLPPGAHRFRSEFENPQPTSRFSIRLETTAGQLIREQVNTPGQ